MGGSVGFTIREENGKEHRMCRWTNCTPQYVNNSKFIEKDKTHLDNYLSIWYEMVDEYTSEEYKTKDLTMSDVYAPNPFLAPMGYGLVVVDYQTNTVLHLQGYTGYGTINPASINNAEHSGDFDRIEDFRILATSNKLKTAMSFDENDELTTIDISKFSIEELYKICTERRYKDVKW